MDIAGDMEFWRKHVMAIERDGWVSSEYARAQDLSVTSLYYRRAKFRSMTSAADPHSKFITLNVMPAQGAASSCVLTIGAVRIGAWRAAHAGMDCGAGDDNPASTLGLAHCPSAPVPVPSRLSQVDRRLVGAGRAGAGP